MTIFITRPSDGFAVAIAWVGTAITYFTADEAQVFIALLTGSLTSLYTVLKIYEWTINRKWKKRKPSS